MSIDTKQLIAPAGSADAEVLQVNGGRIIAAAASGGASPESTYTTTPALVLGEIVHVSGNDTCAKAVATSDNNAAVAIGAAKAIASAAASVQIVTGNVVPCLFIAGLSPTAGDKVFLSTTAGRMTTSVPDGAGNVRQSYGVVKNVNSYSGSEATMTVQWDRGDKTVKLS